jgi:molecular chaperone DnaK
VVLVGGTTKIPHVRDRVARFFGKPPRSDVNPEEAVAIGASLQAAALQRILSEKRTTVKQAVVPPAPPLGQRPPTDLEPLDETTASRTTAPIGSQRAPRPVTQRPATRGESIDVFEGPTAPVSAGPPTEGGRALGRITRPHGMQAIATTAPPPTPAKPPAPPPSPPPTPAARTLYGVPPAAPAPTTFSDLEDETTASRPDPRSAQVRAGTIDTDMPGARPLRITEPPPPGPARVPVSSPTAPTLFGDAAPRPPVLPTPVVLDVTPRSLGIATVAGYCEELIRRNARLPAESTRLFTTSHDKQSTVRIRICQGESRRLDHNVVIGDLVLESLEPRPRGETTIEVIFALDASGVLQVRARDALSGREQSASLAILGAQSQEEVAAAAERVRALRR